MLNVDPLGSPVDPSSVTGDQMVFEYFVETADRSVRGYLAEAAVLGAAFSWLVMNLMRVMKV